MVPSLLTAVVFEAYDWKVVDRAVAFDVEVVVVHAVGLHILTVLPESELDVPYSDVPATMVPPVVSGMVFPPDVSVAP